MTHYELSELMMKDVYMISAVTLIINNMQRSCSFYSKVPGFRLVYGGSCYDSFSTYKIGRGILCTYLNLELRSVVNDSYKTNNDFGRIIFHTDNVDKLYSYFINNTSISKLIIFEDKPMDAPWKERYFHIREPDGYQLSFTQPIEK